MTILHPKYKDEIHNDRQLNFMAVLAKVHIKKPVMRTRQDQPSFNNKLRRCFLITRALISSAKVQMEALSYRTP